MKIAQNNSKSQQRLKHQTASLAEDLKQGDEKLIETIRKEFDEAHVSLDERMKKLEFELEVFFLGQDRRVQEIFENNRVFNEWAPTVLDQIEEYKILDKFFEALKEIERVESFIQNYHLLVEPFERDFYNIREILRKLENNCNGDLDLRLLSLELKEHGSTAFKSRAEAMFNTMKTMGLFKFIIDSEGWLKVSRAKGNEDKINFHFEEIRNIEKLNMKMDGLESIEMMITGLNLLLKNCLEKVFYLCFDFCGRFLSNQEARRFSDCVAIWRDKKIKLTVDFSECTFENEETPLIFFKSERSKLENLEGFKYFLGNTNATQETMDDFSKLIISRMKNLEQFGFDFCNLPINTPVIYEALLNKASGMKKLHFGVQKTAFGNDELIFLSKKVLPQLKSLEELKLRLDQTQIKDEGLMNLFKSIKDNCADRLKGFALSINENNVSDEGLPLMENLEKFELLANKTFITGNILLNLKYCASKLKILSLDLGDAVVTDDIIQSLASSVPMMKKIEEFSICLCGTKITDQSIRNLYLSFAEVFSNVRKFTLSFDKTEVGDESILILGQALSKMVNIKNLVLSFNQTKLSDKSIGPLFSSLKSFARNLVRLSLGFDRTRLTDQGVMMLGNEIAPEMTSLKEFRLQISQTRIGDSSLKVLFGNLKGTMAHIEALHLCLNDSLVGDKALMALAEESLARAESLKSLELWVNKTEISDLGMVSLMSSLRNRVCDIKTLVLSFKGTKVGSETLKALSLQVLRNMQKLQNLGLFFGQSQIDETNISTFFENLAQKIKNVKKFELELNSVFRDLSIQSFADKVLPNLIHVQDFKMNWNAKLTNFTNKALCLNTMKTFKNIKTFALNPSSFEITNGLTRSSLQEISFELNDIDDITMAEILQSFEGQVSQVKAFSFIVKGTKVSDKTIKALADIYFSFMPNLDSLTLNLDRLKISEQVFCYMCRSFEQFAKNFKHFKISLDIANLTTRSIIALAESGLAYMRNLENFELDYNYNKKIEQGLVDLFTQMQNCAPKLQSLSLFLPGVRLLPQTIQALAIYVFPNLKSLVKLKLGLFETKIRESDFLFLFSSMKGILGNIKDFAWAIDEEGFTNQTLESFSNHILPRLENLESFRFSLAKNAKITDEGFVRFNRRLQGVSGKITDLMLRFENTAISNKGVNEFALKTLCEMDSLKNLDINFGENEGINDESIGNLFDSLGEIVEKLSSLKLGLQNTGLGDVGIEIFKERVTGKIDLLERFALDVSGCNLSMKNKSFINGILTKYHSSS